MVFKPLSCLFPCGPGQLHHMITFMCTIGIIMAYLHRSVFNVAIVEMVQLKKEQKPSTCPRPVGQGNSTIVNIGGGKVEWTEQQQQILIAGFFPLYFLLHIPGGLACDRWGARHFLMWSHIISSTLTALTPLASVSFPWWTTLIFRMFVGAAQGVHFPAVSSLLSRWIPITERGTVGGIVYAANAYGMVLGNLGTGMMIKSFQDWQIPYYIWAGIGYFYTLIFFGYVFSDPHTSPFITPIELEYLDGTLSMKKKMNVPFLKIIKDLCVWGMMAAQMGNGFVMFMLSNNVPKYLNNVLGFEISWNAIISLIFLLQWVSGLGFGLLSDYLTKKKNANISWMRKILTSISNIGSAVCLVGVNLVECNHALAIVFFGGAVFFKGIYCAGVKVNIMDITVNNSALIMSMVNGFGSLPGFIGTYLISVMVPNNEHTEWRIYFLMLVGIEVITSILYLALSTSTRRPWDYPPGEEAPLKKKAHHWWLEMTPSDDAIRIEKDRKLVETRKTAAQEAKAKAMEKFKADKAAKDAEKAARKANN